MRITLIVLLLAGCGEVTAASPDAAVTNVAGKHTHMLTVDGLAREVIVYVPAGAAGATPVPVVFMFHGTSGDGEKFYNISGWKEKADAEGFIAVFPTALVHCFFEDENRDGDFDDAGELKLTTKWQAGKLGDEFPLCTDAQLAMLPANRRAAADHPVADDIAYVRSMLALLDGSYAVDDKRIYASGFSNGASFTSRLALEMSESFAALAAGSGGLNLTPSPAPRAMSFVFDVGELDDRFTTLLGVPSLPVASTLFTDLPAFKAGMINPMLTVLSLADSSSYSEFTIGGKKVASFTFASAGNSYTALIVEGLYHQYPNGTNHPLVMADYLWDFFKTQSL